MTETTIERDAVLAALEEHVTDADREADTGQATIDELHARLRAIAPECRAGDAAALAQLEELEAAIATEKRRQQIEELANAEEVERERIKAEAELEAQRNVYRAQRKTAEDDRDAALLRFEKSLAVMVESARVALEHHAEATRFADLVEPGSYRRRLNQEVENRVLRRVHDELGAYYIRPGLLWANDGRAPLAAESSPCVVCEHEQRSEIEAARSNGDSLRVLAERHNVGKSTLSEHFREHAEA